MPLVRISIRKGRSPSEKEALLEAVHSALVTALQIPETDRHQRLCEYAAEDFEIPPGRTMRYTLMYSSFSSSRQWKTGASAAAYPRMKSNLASR